jgi:hypothetical protein
MAPKLNEDADRALLRAIFSQVEMNLDFKLMAKELDLQNAPAARMRFTRFKAKILKKDVDGGASSSNNTPKKAGGGTKEKKRKAEAGDEDGDGTPGKKLKGKGKEAAPAVPQVQSDGEEENEEPSDGEN